jgi:hypothetical protein
LTLKRAAYAGTTTLRCTRSADPGGVSVNGPAAPRTASFRGGTWSRRQLRSGGYLRHRSHAQVAHPVYGRLDMFVVGDRDLRWPTAVFRAAIIAWSMGPYKPPSGRRAHHGPHDGRVALFGSTR